VLRPSSAAAGPVAPRAPPGQIGTAAAPAESTPPRGRSGGGTTSRNEQGDTMAGADENLLFASEALLTGMVTPPQLVAGVRSWDRSRAGSLADHLRRVELIDKQACGTLRELIDEQVRRGVSPAAAYRLAVAAGGAEWEDALRGLAAEPSSGAWETLAAAPTPTPRSLAFAPAPPALGTARFRRLRLHAEGGLGQVWTAEDLDLQREVALKEIRSRFADEPESRARFLHEAAITGRLEHPGIVPVYALGERPDGRPFYVMRFIRGESLQRAVDRYHAALRDPSARAAAESPTLRQLLGRFVDACEAVAYAHSKGVLHRDLKPSNIMLGAYGETLVVDWGLAASCGEFAPSPGENGSPHDAAVRPRSAAATQTGSVLGTPGFMSPEQARGDLAQLTPAADVYSLGATLYCLLHGQPPPTVDDAGPASSADGRSLAERTVPGAVPRALAAVCRKALSAEPQRRYASARALAEDVQRFLDDEPVVARSESLAERVGRWMRRHRSAVAAAFAALVLVATVAAAAAWQISQSRREAWRLAQDNAQLADAEREASRTAQKRQADAERYYALAIQTVDDFLNKVSEDERLKVAGLENLRRDLLLQARDFYELVIAQAEAGNDPLDAKRADAHQRLADIRFQVGDYLGAIDAYTTAAGHIMALGPARIEAERYVAINSDLALAYAATGRRDAAVRVGRVLEEAVVELLANEPDNATLYGLQATVRLNLAVQLQDQAPQEAIALLRAALASVGEASRRAPGSRPLQAAAASIRNQLGGALVAQERFAEAAAELSAAEVAWQALQAGSSGWQAEYLEDQLSQCYLHASALAAGRQQGDEAAARLRLALEIRRRLAERHPDSAPLQERLADMLRLAADRYRELLRHDDSLREAGAAVALYERLIDLHPETPSYRWGLAGALLGKTLTELELGQLTPAQRDAERAGALGAELEAADPGNADYRRIRALVRGYAGLVSLDAAALPRAESLLRDAHGRLEAASEAHPADVAVRLAQADVQAGLAQLHSPLALADAPQSAAWWQASRATAESLLAPPLRDSLPPSMLRQCYHRRARALAALDAPEEALADWTRLAALFPGSLEPEEALDKAAALFAAGRPEEALETATVAVRAAPQPRLPYAAARRLASGASLSPPAPSAADATPWGERFAAAAVELLEIAAERGYFDDPASRSLLGHDPFLAPLRDRADFRALEARLP